MRYKGLDDPSVCNRADYYEDLDGWTIGEIQDAKGLRLVTSAQGIKALKKLGYSVKGYGGFFVRERNGSPPDVYGFPGSVPAQDTVVYRVGRAKREPRGNKCAVCGRYHAPWQPQAGLHIHNGCLDEYNR